MSIIAMIVRGKNIAVGVGPMVQIPKDGELYGAYASQPPRDSQKGNEVTPNAPTAKETGASTIVQQVMSAQMNAHVQSFSENSDRHRIKRKCSASDDESAKRQKRD
jgi:hypothetical protein